MKIGKYLLSVALVLILGCAMLTKYNSSWQTVSLGDIGSIRIPALWDCRMGMGLYSFYNENGLLVLVQIADMPMDGYTYGFGNNEKIVIGDFSCAYGTTVYSNSAFMGNCNCIMNGAQKTLRYIEVFGDLPTERTFFLSVESSVPDKTLQRIAKSYSIKQQ